MPNVDFTKDELVSELRVVLREDLREDMREMMDARFIEERKHTRAMIEDVVPNIVATEFLNFWDSNLGPVLEDMQGKLSEVENRVVSIEHGMKSIVRVQRKHSADITALQALNGV